MSKLAAQSGQTTGMSMRVALGSQGSDRRLIPCVDRFRYQSTPEGNPDFAPKGRKQDTGHPA